MTLLGSACAAVLCGQTSNASIAQWVRHQPDGLLRALGSFRAPPTDGAFRYLFDLLDLGAFEATLAAWFKGLLGAPAEGLRRTPLEGKALNGSDDMLRGAVHLLALLDGRTGGVLKHWSSASGPTSTRLRSPCWRALSCGGGSSPPTPCSATRAWPGRSASGAGTTSSPSRTISSGSRATSSRPWRRPFPPYEARRRLCEDDEAQSASKRGGRLERHALRTTTRLNGYLDWPHFGQVCRLERVVRRDGKETKGAAYAITSAGPELACAATLLGRWRGHWGSENGLHWVRNVTMGEYKSHIRTGAAHEVMAGLHKAAITLLRLAGAANIAQALCENANHASEALT